ncbi:hypothetical protein Agub_g13873 [Astrephomene gubernaculifera]|uniref:Uncharacterized protein n=1 Tax=Astrephomene gubernaculifera TaxID=47775 RepID=A0AAD3E0M0_9CHLO|nr:hypothetical protein Agub_g13873 [Astrephomene gubernaculifera]
MGQCVGKPYDDGALSHIFCLVPRTRRKATKFTLHNKDEPLSPEEQAVDDLLRPLYDLSLEARFGTQICQHVFAALTRAAKLALSEHATSSQASARLARLREVAWGVEELLANFSSRGWLLRLLRSSRLDALIKWRLDDVADLLIELATPPYPGAEPSGAGLAALEELRNEGLKQVAAGLRSARRLQEAVASQLRLVLAPHGGAGDPTAMETFLRRIKPMVQGGDEDLRQLELEEEVQIAVASMSVGPHRALRHPDLQLFWWRHMAGLEEVPWSTLWPHLATFLANSPRLSDGAGNTQLALEVLQSPELVRVLQAAVHRMGYANYVNAAELDMAFGSGTGGGCTTLDEQLRLLVSSDRTILLARTSKGARAEGWAHEAAAAAAARQAAAVTAAGEDEDDEAEIDDEWFDAGSSFSGSENYVSVGAATEDGSMSSAGRRAPPSQPTATPADRANMTPWTTGLTPSIAAFSSRRETPTASFRPAERDPAARVSAPRAAPTPANNTCTAAAAIPTPPVAAAAAQAAAPPVDDARIRPRRLSFGGRELASELASPSVGSMESGLSRLVGRDEDLKRLIDAILGNPVTGGPSRRMRSSRDKPVRTSTSAAAAVAAAKSQAAAAAVAAASATAPQPPPPAVLLVSGPRGCGKTALVTAAADRLVSSGAWTCVAFADVRCLAGAEEAALAMSLALNVPFYAADRAAGARLLSWLRTHGSRLKQGLVLDNVDMLLGMGKDEAMEAARVGPAFPATPRSTVSPSPSGGGTTSIGGYSYASAGGGNSSMGGTGTLYRYGHSHGPISHRSWHRNTPRLSADAVAEDRRRRILRLLRDVAAAAPGLRLVLVSGPAATREILQAAMPHGLSVRFFSVEHLSPEASRQLLHNTISSANLSHHNQPATKNNSIMELAADEALRDAQLKVISKACDHLPGLLRLAGAGVRCGTVDFVMLAEAAAEALRRGNAADTPEAALAAFAAHLVSHSVACLPNDARAVLCCLASLGCALCEEDVLAAAAFLGHPGLVRAGLCCLYDRGLLCFQDLGQRHEVIGHVRCWLLRSSPPLIAPVVHGTSAGGGGSGAGKGSRSPTNSGGSGHSFGRTGSTSGGGNGVSGASTGSTGGRVDKAYNSMTSKETGIRLRSLVEYLDELLTQVGNLYASGCRISALRLYNNSRTLADRALLLLPAWLRRAGPSSATAALFAAAMARHLNGVCRHILLPGQLTRAASDLALMVPALPSLQDRLANHVATSRAHVHLMSLQRAVHQLSAADALAQQLYPALAAALEAAQYGAPQTPRTPRTPRTPAMGATVTPRSRGVVVAGAQRAGAAVETTPRSKVRQLAAGKQQAEKQQPQVQAQKQVQLKFGRKQRGSGGGAGGASGNAVKRAASLSKLPPQAAQLALAHAEVASAARQYGTAVRFLTLFLDCLTATGQSQSLEATQAHMQLGDLSLRLGRPKTEAVMQYEIATNMLTQLYGQSHFRVGRAMLAAARCSPDFLSTTALSSSSSADGSAVDGVSERDAGSISRFGRRKAKFAGASGAAGAGAVTFRRRPIAILLQDCLYVQQLSQGKFNLDVAEVEVARGSVLCRLDRPDEALCCGLVALGIVLEVLGDGTPQVSECLDLVATALRLQHRHDAAAAVALHAHAIRVYDAAAAAASGSDSGALGSVPDIRPPPTEALVREQLANHTTSTTIMVPGIPRPEMEWLTDQERSAAASEVSVSVGGAREEGTPLLERSPLVRVPLPDSAPPSPGGSGGASKGASSTLEPSPLLVVLLPFGGDTGSQQQQDAQEQQQASQHPSQASRGSRAASKSASSTATASTTATSAAAAAKAESQAGSEEAAVSEVGSGGERVASTTAAASVAVQHVPQPPPLAPVDSMPCSMGPEVSFKSSPRLQPEPSSPNAETPADQSSSAASASPTSPFANMATASAVAVAAGLDGGAMAEDQQQRHSAEPAKEADEEVADERQQLQSLSGEADTVILAEAVTVLREPAKEDEAAEEEDLQSAQEESEEPLTLLEDAQGSEVLPPQQDPVVDQPAEEPLEQQALPAVVAAAVVAEEEQLETVARAQADAEDEEVQSQFVDAASVLPDADTDAGAAGEALSASWDAGLVQELLPVSRMPSTERLPSIERLSSTERFTSSERLPSGERSLAEILASGNGSFFGGVAGMLAEEEDDVEDEPQVVGSLVADLVAKAVVVSPGDESVTSPKVVAIAVAEVVEEAPGSLAVVLPTAVTSSTEVVTPAETATSTEAVTPMESGATPTESGAAKACTTTAEELAGAVAAAKATMLAEASTQTESPATWQATLAAAMAGTVAAVQETAEAAAPATEAAASSPADGEDIPAAEEALVTEEAPLAEETPATEDVPVAGEMPATEEAPATAEVPATEEAVSAESPLPLSEEAVSDSDPVAVAVPLDLLAIVSSTPATDELLATQELVPSDLTPAVSAGSVEAAAEEAEAVLVEVEMEVASELAEGLEEEGEEQQPLSVEQAMPAEETPFEVLVTEEMTPAEETPVDVVAAQEETPAEETTPVEVIIAEETAPTEEDVVVSEEAMPTEEVLEAVEEAMPAEEIIAAQATAAEEMADEGATASEYMPAEEATAGGQMADEEAMPAEALAAAMPEEFPAQAELDAYEVLDASCDATSEPGSSSPAHSPAAGSNLPVSPTQQQPDAPHVVSPSADAAVPTASSTAEPGQQPAETSVASASMQVPAATTPLVPGPSMTPVSPLSPTSPQPSDPGSGSPLAFSPDVRLPPPPMGNLVAVSTTAAAAVSLNCSFSAGGGIRPAATATVTASAENVVTTDSAAASEADDAETPFVRPARFCFSPHAPPPTHEEGALAHLNRVFNAQVGPDAAAATEREVPHECSTDFVPRALSIRATMPASCPAAGEAPESPVGPRELDFNCTYPRKADTTADSDAMADSADAAIEVNTPSMADMGDLQAEPAVAVEPSAAYHASPEAPESAEEAEAGRSDDAAVATTPVAEPYADEATPSTAASEEAMSTPALAGDHLCSEHASALEAGLHSETQDADDVSFGNASPAHGAGSELPATPDIPLEVSSEDESALVSSSAGGAHSPCDAAMYHGGSSACRFGGYGDDAESGVMSSDVPLEVSEDEVAPMDAAGLQGEVAEYYGALQGGCVDSHHSPSGSSASGNRSSPLGSASGRSEEEEDGHSSAALASVYEENDEVLLEPEQEGAAEGVESGAADCGSSACEGSPGGEAAEERDAELWGEVAATDGGSLGYTSCGAREVSFWEADEEQGVEAETHCEAASGNDSSAGNGVAVGQHDGCVVQAPLAVSTEEKADEQLAKARDEVAADGADEEVQAHCEAAADCCDGSAGNDAGATNAVVGAWHEQASEEAAPSWARHCGAAAVAVVPGSLHVACPHGGDAEGSDVISSELVLLTVEEVHGAVPCEATIPEEEEESAACERSLSGGNASAELEQEASMEGGLPLPAGGYDEQETAAEVEELGAAACPAAADGSAGDNTSADDEAPMTPAAEPADPPQITDLLPAASLGLEPGSCVAAPLLQPATASAPEVSWAVAAAAGMAHSAAACAPVDDSPADDAGAACTAALASHVCSPSASASSGPSRGNSPWHSHQAAAGPSPVQRRRPFGKRSPGSLTSSPPRTQQEAQATKSSPSQRASPSKTSPTRRVSLNQSSPPSRKQSPKASPPKRRLSTPGDSSPVTWGAPASRGRAMLPLRCSSDGGSVTRRTPYQTPSPPPLPLPPPRSATPTTTAGRTPRATPATAGQGHRIPPPPASSTPTSSLPYHRPGFSRIPAAPSSAKVLSFTPPRVADAHSPAVTATPSGSQNPVRQTPTPGAVRATPRRIPTGPVTTPSSAAAAPVAAPVDPSAAAATATAAAAPTAPAAPSNNSSLDSAFITSPAARLAGSYTAAYLKAKHQPSEGVQQQPQMRRGPSITPSIAGAPANSSSRPSGGGSILPHNSANTAPRDPRVPRGVKLHNPLFVTNSTAAMDLDLNGGVSATASISVSASMDDYEAEHDEDQEYELYRQARMAMEAGGGAAVLSAAAAAQRPARNHRYQPGLASSQEDVLPEQSEEEEEDGEGAPMRGLARQSSPALQQQPLPQLREGLRSGSGVSNNGRRSTFGGMGSSNGDLGQSGRRFTSNGSGAGGSVGRNAFGRFGYTGGAGNNAAGGSSRASSAASSVGSVRSGIPKPAGLMRS